MKNKTKPFNLEDAINGKKIVTRDGEVVTDFKHFNINSSHCIYAVVRYQVKSFTINGHYITDCVKCDIDLLIEE